ncbi:MAG: hypothetical protein LIO97_08335 [Tannerellaceae bacterium]|nr:hypothetical protein [Tannerellaceae bacterium]
MFAVIVCYPLILNARLPELTYYPGKAELTGRILNYHPDSNYYLRVIIPNLINPNFSPDFIDIEVDGTFRQLLHLQYPTQVN